MIAAASPALAQRKEREPPAPVAPVSSGGIRYEAPPWGKDRGWGQNGGYVVAIDEGSGRELLAQRIYRVTYDRRMEGDKQDVFVTSLALAGDGRTLLIGNARGERFRLDPVTRKVSRERR